MISILCPTRERVDKAKRYLESIVGTALGKDFEVLFYVDDDDPLVDEYDVLNGEFSRVVVGSHDTVSIAWNRLAKISQGNILMMGNDDCIHETKSWDTIIHFHAARYFDDIFCLYGDDGVKKNSQCTFPIVSRKWYNIVGYFVPEIFMFGYNDAWIEAIAKKLNRLEYIPHLTIKHLHFTYGNPIDGTYKMNRNNNQPEKDKKIFNENQYLVDIAANKLRKVMRG